MEEKPKRKYNYTKKTGRPARSCETAYMGYRIDKKLKEEFDKLGPRRRIALEYAMADYIGYPRKKIGK
jgi:hypothetical protein